MHTPSWIELNRAALRFNCEQVRELAPQANILAMVKANGYGHGADWVVESIADLVGGFGVARFDEAYEIRRVVNNPQAKRHRLLLIANAASPALLQDCAEQGFDFAVSNFEAAQCVAQTSLPAPISTWLKLNIGMNRLGMSVTEFERAHHLLHKHPNCRDIIHMSHFSESEDRDHSATNRQAAQILNLSAQLGNFPRSLANSAAIISHPRTHREWVRPGIMLYGDDPTGLLSGDKQLKPVMSFKSQIIALKDVAEGDGVGYNRRWRAPGPRRIATVAAGYADGYPRSAPDGTPVLVHGKRAALAGRVSMDLLTIDVSDIPETKLGDEVTLWGEGLPAAEVGRHCQTISYELFTRITERVERRWL
ncbi:alanine racemase [Spongiibacter sp. KMU-158]|uniref:Alanine racemase n=1 Tax=Spongiibacter pelagi TaxID=2760804 RepID=A0A927C3A5_9GAMM|nr:alanine racemase [Spongiibacter pelagi]MBD2859222.1 alanine racemase [Spongiibacter pelagi]